MSSHKAIRKVTAVFIGLILFFTFFSKTIKNINTPIVEVGEKESGYLTNIYRGYGKVKPDKLLSYYLPASLVIDSVEVIKGEEVGAGDILLKINREKFNKVYNNELKKYLELKNMHNSKREELAYIEYGSLKLEELEKRGKLKKDEMESQKKLYENGYISKKDLDLVINSYEALNLRYLEERNREEVRVRELKGELDLLNLELPLMELRIEKLDKIKPDYSFRAENSGFIYSIGISEGGVTTEDMVLVSIVNRDSEYAFEGHLDAISAREIKEGDHATVFLEGKGDITGFVTRVLSGSVTSTIEITLEDSEIIGSEEGSFIVKSKSRYYECIVPREALRGGGRNRFVYVTHREKGALSSYSLISKVKVEVLEESFSQAAIIAPLNSESRLVVYEDRPITKSVDRVIIQ